VVPVGKRRDGGTRYWCLKHKADATAKYGKPAAACRTAHLPPIMPSDVLTLDFATYPGGVALWGAVPPVYDTTNQPLDRGIHVHARVTPDSKKELDQTFRAVRIIGKNLLEGGLYVDELDAIYYMATSVFGYTMRHVRCTYCGHAHLDKDWFSVHPHARHLCAGCGKYFRDTQTGIGNPICGLRDACGLQIRDPKVSKRILDIRQRDYPGGIQIWGSNPAFLWTSKATEEEGIHVHAYRGNSQWPDVDETYGKVTIDGITLDPVMVRLLMAQSVLPSVKDRVVPVACPKCGEGILSQGDLAFTPVTTHQCLRCNRDVTATGRLRKTIANPLPTVLARLAAFADRPPRKQDLGLLPETI
jgi:DNA-directed RNA polymerase subunit RPC12/RpoP